ncbi:MAG: hypothetical protein HYX27_13635 [Acidobacteria bacterium]|nr:hypothetical protein [Acidobacteriota bacterium]
MRQALREFVFPEVGEDVLREESAIVRFGVPPHRIEILRQASGLTFEEAWGSRVAWESN